MGGEKKKRNGEALMKFEKQRKYIGKTKVDEKKTKKKKKIHKKPNPITCP